MNNNNNPEAGQGKGQGSIKYKGVRLRKWGKWVAEIRLPNSRDRIWLGSYDSQEKAARAFDAALFCLRGRHAKFNFPDQLPPADILHDPDSLTAHQIQQIAAKFAHHHHSSSDHQNDAVPLSVDHILPPPPPPPPTLDQYGYNDAINSSSSSASASEQQHNDNIMDWSFLDALDDSSSHFFPLYSHHSIDNISTNDFYQSTSVDDHHHYDAVSPDHDPHHSSFSNHSFLWNF